MPETSVQQLVIVECRVPVPVHVNNLGTPREQQNKQVAVPVAVLPDASSPDELQQSTNSSDHMCKLLSLPSFGKVVYRSNNFGPINAAASKQRSLSSSGARGSGKIDSQQMLLQGRASSLARRASLEFDSQFESGNLQKAVQASNLDSCRPIICFCNAAFEVVKRLQSRPCQLDRHMSDALHVEILDLLLITWQRHMCCCSSM